MNFFEKIQKLTPFLGESEISEFIKNHNWLENEDDESIILDYLHFHFKALAEYNTNLASKILLMKENKSNNNINVIKEESKEILIEENKSQKQENYFPFVLQKIEEMSVFLNDDAEYLRHLEYIYIILSAIKKNPNDVISREIRLLQSDFILYRFIIEILNALAFQACELEEETLLFYSENTFEEWDSVLIFINEKIEELNKRNAGNNRVNTFLSRQKQTQNIVSNSNYNAQNSLQDQMKEYRQRMKEKFASPSQTQNQYQMMFSNISPSGNGIMMNQTMSMSNQGISFQNRTITLSDIENKRNIENVNLFAQRILQLTNEFRKSNGKSLLQYHNSLQDIGIVHSKNMGEGKVPFGHQGFNERVQKFPFSHRGAFENVAYCTTGYNDIPKTIVDGWIASPGHKKNLLSNSDVMGVGVYRATNGNWYFTQLFAKY